MADDRDILTVKEISDLLRLHPATVYRLVKQGKIPSFRIGSEWRFRKDVIMRWMAQRTTEAQEVRKVIDTGVNGEFASGGGQPSVDLSARDPSLILSLILPRRRRSARRRLTGPFPCQISGLPNLTWRWTASNFTVRGYI
jgi:excisionase family DNA binding protein